MRHFVQKGHRSIFLVRIDVDSPLTPFTSTAVICEQHLVPRQATSKISLVVLGEQTLEVHLVKRLLHVQHMLCRHLDQTAAMSPERANSTNEARRTEAGTQQTHRMEVLKPLAVRHVGLSAGNIFYVLRVDETHL